MRPPRQDHLRLCALALASLLVACQPPAQPPTGTPDGGASTGCSQSLQMQSFRDAGWTPSWLHTTDEIAYNRPDETGYYNVYLVGLDGGGERSPTRGNPLLPGRHAGRPTWHP